MRFKKAKKYLIFLMYLFFIIMTFLSLYFYLDKWGKLTVQKLYFLDEFEYRERIYNKFQKPLSKYSFFDTRQINSNRLTPIPKDAEKYKITTIPFQLAAALNVSAIESLYFRDVNIKTALTKAISYGEKRNSKTSISKSDLVKQRDFTTAAVIARQVESKPQIELSKDNGNETLKEHVTLLKKQTVAIFYKVNETKYGFLPQINTTVESEPPKKSTTYIKNKYNYINKVLSTNSLNNVSSMVLKLNTIISTTESAPKFNPIASKARKTGLVNVYHYDDLCGISTYALTWNPLFPNIPSKAEMRSEINDASFILNTKSFRKITGFIIPHKSDWYTFELASKFGAEFILIDKYAGIEKNNVLEEFLLRLKISEERIKKEDKKVRLWDLFKEYSKKIYLQKGKKYLYDITQVWPFYGMFTLKWKIGDSSFIPISQEMLSPLNEVASINPILPQIKYFNKTQKFKLYERNPKNRVRSALNDSLSLEGCQYNASYIPEKIPKDYGIAFIKVDNIYPDDVLLHDHSSKDSSIGVIDNKTADDVVKVYMSALNSNYTLVEIVNIEENQETTIGKRYFIEIDVQKNSSVDVYRSSGWIIKKKDGNVCHPLGYSWNNKEIIYLLTPIKNQGRWLKHMISYLNDIVSLTADHNIHLMIVDFNSTDRNVTQILSSASFNFTLLTLYSKFNKVKGLNHAVKSIEEKDALMFVLDLQLQLPHFIFGSIRKHTFKGQTTYVPILLRLGCGEHPHYTAHYNNSAWMGFGYGMISIYKSDWQKIGGMDEIQFGEKWGGEDWEIIDRILMNKIEVIHHRISGYYHYYHSRLGTWEGTASQ